MLTQRLQEMLELYAVDRLTHTDFLLELDRLEQHFQETASAITNLKFSADYDEGRVLQEHYQSRVEEIFEALDWMRDFAEVRDLELAEKSLEVSENAEAALDEIRAALGSEIENTSGGSFLG